MAYLNSCQNWERFPATIHNDVEFLLQRLLEDSSRLFALDQNRLESMRLSVDKQVELSSMADVNSLNDFLEANNADTQECIYIIRQANSWERFDITLDVFQKLLAHESIFPAFLNCVQAFGFKIDEDEKPWDGFRSYVPSSIQDYESFELCYNIRYVDKHGRESSNPWSLRQSGIYHRFNRQTNKSTWVFLQPSERLQKRFQKVLPHKSIEANDPNGNPMLLHILIFSTMSENWDEFIGDLRTELTKLDDKACFSRVGMNKRNDYSLTFTDMQKIQLFRQKVLRIVSVLDSCYAVARGCEFVSRQMNVLEMNASSEIFSASLRPYLDDLDRHRRGLTTLLDYSTGTANLLSKILECRNGEVALKAQKGIERSLLALNRITEQGAELAERGQADSKTLKALTTIATMYLPASLLATIFSSNLIELRPDNYSGDGHSHYQIVSEFWLYIVLTIFLSIVTVVIVMLLERKTSRRHNCLST